MAKKLTIRLNVAQAKGNDAVFKLNFSAFFIEYLVVITVDLYPIALING